MPIGHSKIDVYAAPANRQHLTSILENVAPGVTSYAEALGYYLIVTTFWAIILYTAWRYALP